MNQRRATDRAFKLFVCGECDTQSEPSVHDELRTTIRRCPRGVLVSAECMLGPVTCATRTRGPGVMVLLQPFSGDQVSAGPVRWIGPVVDREDTAAVRKWVESGSWDITSLPLHLRASFDWMRKSSRRN